MTLEARDLINSPVGRQLCLTFLESLADCERPESDDSAAGAFQRVLRTASMVMDLSNGRSEVFGWDPEGKPLQQETFLEHLRQEALQKGLVGPSTGKTLAKYLDNVELTEISDMQLMQALGQAADAMHFWGQTPSGEEKLSQLPEMRKALLRVAQHIVSSAASSWWYEPWAPTEQWLVKSISPALGQSANDPQPRMLQEHESFATLIHNAFDQTECEEGARRDRRANPQQVFGGTWWSFPPYRLDKTTSMIPGVGPVGVFCEEDGRGDDTKVAWLVESSGKKIFEVTCAGDWARLCSWYPADVTATRLDMWEMNTSRQGKWVIPDWLKVATDFDGVHLTAAAYIALAGNAIPVPELGAPGEWASSITGWTPDWTFYFSPLKIVPQTKHIWKLNDSQFGAPTWRSSLAVADEAKKH